MTAIVHWTSTKEIQDNAVNLLLLTFFRFKDNLRETCNYVTFNAISMSSLWLQPHSMYNQCK